MIASHSGCAGIVSMLLEHGSEVNQQDVSIVARYALLL